MLTNPNCEHADEEREFYARLDDEKLWEEARETVQAAREIREEAEGGLLLGGLDNLWAQIKEA